MSDGSRLSGEWTPRRQAMAYQQVLESVSLARQTVVEFDACQQHARDKALRASADALIEHRGELLRANEADLADAREAGMGPGGLDRLTLTEQRLGELSDYLGHIAELPCPLTDELPGRSELARVPLGVVGVIYEAAPATTVLASAPLLKAGNAVLLRGSAAAARTDTALIELLRGGLHDAQVPMEAVQAVPIAERATVRYLVSAYGLVDLVILRAGVSLSRRVRGDATVPLLDLGHGICHLYLDASADAELAAQLVVDAATSHPSWTGSAHTVLIHREAAARLLPAVVGAATAAGVGLRADEHVIAAAGGVAMPVATDDDWRDEYLDRELALRVVESLDAALAHIAQFGTGHTETIIAEDHHPVRLFAARVNAATVAINSPTAAPELFITERSHTRGPLNPVLFTTTKQLRWPA